MLENYKFTINEMAVRIINKSMLESIPGAGREVYHNAMTKMTETASWNAIAVD